MTPPRPSPPPSVASAVLSTVDAAAYLGISASALNADRRLRHLKVPFYRIGKRVVYRTPDLDAWLEQRRVDAATGGAPCAP